MSIPLIISLNIGRLIAKFWGGTALPGFIAEKINPNLINQIALKNNLQSIVITGTNGKTSIARLLGEVLTLKGIRYCHNQSGSNLIRGLATGLINQSDWRGRLKANTAVWEVDEAVLPQALAALNPQLVLFTNLSRDQMDRYGEIDHLLNLWQSGLNNLKAAATVIINAADPKLKKLQRPRLIRFGQAIPGAGLKYPRNSGGKFNYDAIWAVTAIVNHLKIKTDVVSIAAKAKPAFGRGEIVKYMGQNLQINLIKNPASAKAVWQMLADFNQVQRPLLIVLNDRLADGTDVSWIWDVPFIGINRRHRPVIVSGTRAADLALRLKYAGIKSSLIIIKPNMAIALKELLSQAGSYKHILPTYTALLELRKLLGAKSWN